jgi:hypothetical protein
MTTLRRGHARTYKVVNPQYQPGSTMRSCGKCGQHRGPEGGSKHRVLGWCCAACTLATEARAA